MAVRVACPWLIRKFIGPKAEFLFVPWSLYLLNRLHPSIMAPSFSRYGTIRSMAHTEAPSNWLSKIIEEQRRTIDRAFPRRERKAVCTSIVVAIQANPNGAALVANPTLHDVVLAALDVAAALERAMERDPHLMTASPAMQAAWYIFDKLGLQRPDPEF